MWRANIIYAHAFGFDNEAISHNPGELDLCSRGYARVCVVVDTGLRHDTGHEDVGIILQQYFCICGQLKI